MMKPCSVALYVAMFLLIVVMENAAVLPCGLVESVLDVWMT
jgi:hypothetical protein